jgi:hypothetical protein
MSTSKSNLVRLIDRLMIVLQEEEPNLSLKERAMFKMGISLLDQIDHPVWKRPENSFRVYLTEEEYLSLPGRIEFASGQPMLLD